MSRSAGRWLLGILQWLGFAVLAMAGLVAVGGGLLAWRLSEGPIAAPWLARRIERAADARLGGAHLAVGQAALAWDGFRLGVDHPLELRLAGLRLTDAQAHTVDTVATLAVSASLTGLLAGEVAPRAITLEGARLAATRRPDGTLDLGFGGPAATGIAPGPGTASGATGWGALQQELSRPAQTDASAGARNNQSNSKGSRLRLNQLRAVNVRDTTLTIADAAPGTALVVTAPDINLARLGDGGVQGHAEAGLALGPATTRLVLDAGLAPGGATHVTAKLAPIAPAALGAVLPAVAGITAPVGGTASVDLGPDLALRHFTLQASAGAGAVQVGGAAETLASATLAADGDPDNVQLRALHVVLALPDGAGPVFDGNGSVHRAAGHLTADLSLGLDRLAFTDLATIWPEGVGHDARSWLTQNITAGIAHDLHVHLGLAGNADFTGMTITAADGGVLGDDITVWWLRPLPPVEHATAHLTLTGPDTLDIATEGGHLATGTSGITLQAGDMKIAGLTVKDQTSTITLGATGGVGDIVALLSQRRLHLLSDHPLPLGTPSGSFVASLNVQLPLDNKVTIDQIAIRSTAALSKVHLGAIVAGHDLDDGTFTLTVSNDGLILAGRAKLAHVPAALTATTDFRPGPPSGIAARVEASGTATGEQLAAAGLGTAGLLVGPATIDAVYTQPRQGDGQVQVKADLAGTTLDSGQLGWTKGVGQPGTASARLLLDKGRLAAIDKISAEAPGLSIEGRADFAANKPQVLVLSRGVVGRTQVSGTIRLATHPGEPIVIALSGPQIDLAGQLGSHQPVPPKQADTAGAREPSVPWQIKAQFTRVLLAGNHAAGPMNLSAQSDGRVIRTARVEVSGTAPMLATIGPGGANGRALAIDAADAGALLAALDVTDAISGGKLSLKGEFDDRAADHPLSGRAEISNFRFANAPAIAHLLQALTVYGLLDRLGGPGMQVDRAIAPFRLDADTLTLEEARAFNSALGVTAAGSINLGASTADITGTIVPAYLFNSVLGRIPVIGRLFSPERGGGVFAATYAMKGKLADPSVSVNPLAALAPGFLRNVFGGMTPAAGH